MSEGMLSRVAEDLLLLLYRMPKHRVPVTSVVNTYTRFIGFGESNYDQLMNTELMTLTVDEDNLYYALTTKGVLVAKLMGADER